MKLETGIDSIEARIQEEKLVIWSKTPLKVLSSAVFNGGLREANGILNVHVLEDGSVDDEIHRNASDFMKREILHST